MTECKWQCLERRVPRALPPMVKVRAAREGTNEDDEEEEDDDDDDETARGVVARRVVEEDFLKRLERAE